LQTEEAVGNTLLAVFMNRALNPDVTFVNAVIVTKADPVRPQQTLADADSGHGR
jgi:hypothetical protein